MSHPVFDRQFPEDIVEKAFEKYPEKYEIIQHGPFFDHTGEDMSDFEEDINERPRIAWIRGFLEALEKGGIYHNQ